MPDIFTPQHNRLLAALRPDVRARIFPSLERVALSQGEVVAEHGEVMMQAYFPVDCIVSLTSITESGSTADVSMVGNEGIIGTAIFMEGDTSSSRAIVQSGGTAYRLAAAKLMAEFGRYEQLSSLLLRYTLSMIAQMAQTVACNRHHVIIQQLSRCLLHSLDRLPGNRVGMTQGMIAGMLGVRREGVTEAALRLQKLGVIRYSRGQITVLNRPRLERMSCECYAVVKKEADRLLPRTYAESLERRVAA